MFISIYNAEAIKLLLNATYSAMVIFLEYNFVFFFSIKIGYEFDFIREADAMERIRCFLYENNKKRPVLVPRVMHDMVTRYVILQIFFFLLEAIFARDLLF